MVETKKLYLDDFTKDSCQARVINVFRENDRDVVVLDQTIFYPQGGGQPCDWGTIQNNQTIFNVNDVRLIDGIVKHFGIFSSAAFEIGQEVCCVLDKERRKLHSRLHSAGHVLDKALYELGLNWLPGKSYHFPNGPYVEYSGSLHNVDIDKLKNDIENLCNLWIADGMVVTSHAIDKKTVLANEQLIRRCAFLVNLPENKPIYVIGYGDNFSSPCSGTHVTNVSEVGQIVIRKIKECDGIIRISYDIKPRSNG